MPFIQEILKCNSVSIVGLEKNTGKTECLNYVIRRLKQENISVAVTSIGLDGEDKDQLYQTKKPEIEVFEDMIFITSEKHYREKKVISEILSISSQQTSLGRLITARAKNQGKTLLSGPSNTTWLQSLIDKMQMLSVRITLVDGALSRLSLASPTITDGMILNTGAALSANIPQLVKRTSFVYKLAQLEEVDFLLKQPLSKIERGIWAIDKDGNIHDLNIPSVFGINNRSKDLFSFGTTLFISGAISDYFLNYLRLQKQIKDILLIIKDFTKAFVSEEIYQSFVKKGGQLKVLQRANLIALCVNPVSPNGIRLNSAELRSIMQQTLQVPVYDIRQIPH